MFISHVRMSLKTFSVNLQPVQIHRQLHLHQQGIHLEASTFEHTLSSNLSPDFLFTAPSHLASAVSPSLHSQAKLLRLISLFLTPAIQPVLWYDALALSPRSATDRFDATLVSAFDVADGRGDEAVVEMKTVSCASTSAQPFCSIEVFNGIFISEDISTVVYP